MAELSKFSFFLLNLPFFLNVFFSQFFLCSIYLLTPRTVTCGTPLTSAKLFRVSPSHSSPQTYCCTVRGLTWSSVMTVLTPINRYEHLMPSISTGLFVYRVSSFSKMNSTVILGLQLFVEICPFEFCTKQHVLI